MATPDRGSVGFLSPEQAAVLQNVIDKRCRFLERDIRRASEVIVQREQIQIRLSGHPLREGLLGRVQSAYRRVRYGDLSASRKRQLVMDRQHEITRLESIPQDLQAGVTDSASKLLAREIENNLVGLGIGFFGPEDAEGRRVMREGLFSGLIFAHRVNRVLRILNPQQGEAMGIEIKKAVSSVQSGLGNPLGNSIPEELAAYLLPDSFE